MTSGVQLLVPIKPLHLAKTRLRGASEPADRHSGLVAALASDTVVAARSTTYAVEVIVVTSDPHLTALFRDNGVEVLDDSPASGLNAALRYGDRVLRQRNPEARVGALQADLPALRPEDLDAAITEAGADRVFCSDGQGTGTTLLLARRGSALRPEFGPGSARAHRNGGARELRAPLESLRRDVDLPADLEAAAALGLGAHTSTHVRAAEGPESVRGPA
ncbi:MULTISPECIES: 2-phospho-L-lactate guanylyltransferase [unclassified Actinopolyspora]|uniref:2-phospho-L-lactate guanylyltransferase n=1 Tax=Actinopolyspora TaxID=1849 RepID=UPI0013F5F7C9|nr:2-phospho-L-lactate guanylyltransferase [Actinopolyspora sp. BKK2]NHE76448.1 2-phospho-L-lactate guanylyltransferase [Actinopolyspora sp. BKK1]